MVRRRALWGVRSCLLDLGLRADEMRTVGLPHVALDDEGWLAFDDVLAIYRRAGDLRPGFGLELAVSRDLEFLGPIAALVRFAPDLRTGLDDVSRLIGYQNTGFEFMVDPGRSSNTYAFEMTDERRRDADEWVEESLATTVRVCRSASSSPLDGVRVEMRHRMRAGVEHAVATFGSRPVDEGRVDAVTIGAGDLDRPGPLASRTMYRFLVDAIAGGLPSATGLRGDVTVLVEQLLPMGDATLATVARCLGAHPRTLQRALARQDLSFSRIVDGTRRRLAEQLVRDGAMSLAEISAALGYRDQSAFTHAFTRWHGVPPRRWRFDAIPS